MLARRASNNGVRIGSPASTCRARERFSPALVESYVDGVHVDPIYIARSGGFGLPARDEWGACEAEIVSTPDCRGQRLAASAERLSHTGGAGVVMPSSASAASISSRLMPRRYITASM